MLEFMDWLICTFLTCKTAVVEEKEEEEGPAATKAALPGKPSGDFEIIKGG